MDQFSQNSFASGTGSTSAPQKPIGKLDLSEIIEDMFLVLTNKEKDVIVKRFSLDNKPKLTLEKIGQAFSVTRERIRQIEAKALEKIQAHQGISRLRDY